MNNKRLKNMIACLSIMLGTSMINPGASLAAWKQDSNGWWNTEGNSYSVGWRNISGSWYYFGSDGYMKTGWLKENNTWYYLNNSGEMKTGWLNNNNSWYYLDSSGAMKTGWINDNNTWYYTNQSGSMETGLISIDNKTYYFNESGAMMTGDVTINGVTYKFSENGEQISSFITNNSSENIIQDSNLAQDKKEDYSEEKQEGLSGSGGGGAASTENDNITFLTYSDLYGQWRIDSALENTGIKTTLSDYLINSAIGQEFTVSKDKIETLLGTVVNPTIKENILSNAEFKSKWGVNLSKIGVSGNSIKCITLSALDSDNVKRTGYVLIDSNDRVFAMVKGTVFKLERN